jgi:uncharacterized protein YndB with AHSA1/START domain
MIEIEADIEIAATPEAVWAIMSDPSREHTWMRAVQKADFVGPPRYAEGARMRREGRFLGKRMAWESEIAECVAARRLVFRHVAGSLRGESRWEIEPTAGGTRVRLSSLGPLPRVLSWLRPIAAMGGRAALRADLRRLKGLAEAARSRS